MPSKISGDDFALLQSSSFVYLKKRIAICISAPAISYAECRGHNMSSAFCPKLIKIGFNRSS